jgi:hypothetical protein
MRNWTTLLTGINIEELGVLNSKGWERDWNFLTYFDLIYKGQYKIYRVAMANTKHIASNYKYPGISTDQCRLASSPCCVVAVPASCLTERGIGYEKRTKFLSLCGFLQAFKADVGWKLEICKGTFSSTFLQLLLSNCFVNWKRTITSFCLITISFTETAY